jgi:hypothetical protein
MTGKRSIPLAKYEQIVEMANEGIWTVDARNLTDFINERGAAILGYRPEEMLGRPPADFFLPDSLDGAQEWLGALMGGEAANYELHLRRKDGSGAWVLASTRPLFAKDGSYEGALNVFSDITERKRTEEALHRSQQMLSLVLDSVPGRVFWKDLELNYLGCNRSAARDAGLEGPEDIVGRSDHDLAWKSTANDHRADDLEVIRTGVPKLGYEEVQFREDGPRWLRTSKVPLRDPNGRIIGVLGTSEDITDRKAAEKRLEEYARQLERSNEELQELAYVASHDLKEPLRMVTLSLDILRRKHGAEIGPNVDQYLSTAIEGAERMRRLINDLLTYSRVEAQAREFGAVDMRAALEAALEYLRASIEESQAEVYVGELPTVLADEVQMKQLWTNLISNAVKYRSEARPVVSITCSAQGDMVVFSVRDNGIGIEPRHLPSLFRMFHRLHSRHEYSGTGIGLAVCKKIVERHGGKIWAESDGVSGSNFLFTLPSLSAPAARLRK